MEAAGAARIPFTTGVLVGIGETATERIDALLAIAAAHTRHGHVQEVIVQNFLPKLGTAMHGSPPCDHEEFLRTIATARLLLPAEVHLQAPPNLTDAEALADLIGAGIDDWGGVSPVTPDHVNPERPWPTLDVLRARRPKRPVTVWPRASRSTPSSCDPRTGGSIRTCAPAVRQASDLEGLARDDAWASGGEAPPPLLLEIAATAP